MSEPKNHPYTPTSSRPTPAEPPTPAGSPVSNLVQGPLLKLLFGIGGCAVVAICGTFLIVFLVVRHDLISLGTIVFSTPTPKAKPASAYFPPSMSGSVIPSPPPGAGIPVNTSEQMVRASNGLVGYTVLGTTDVISKDSQADWLTLRIASPSNGGRLCAVKLEPSEPNNKRDLIALLKMVDSAPSGTKCFTFVHSLRDATKFLGEHELKKPLANSCLDVVQGRTNTMPADGNEDTQLIYYMYRVVNPKPFLEAANEVSGTR